jgi:hypothetical protein
MACPYFFPIVRHDAELWQHRRRLPLGDGFLGRCTAPGACDHLSDHQIGHHCNLGYATDCPHLPLDRSADAAHFCVASDKDGIVVLSWVLVKNHAAASFGTLTFDRSLRRWLAPHPETNLQQMADCYLQAYFSRRGDPLGNSMLETS